MKTFKNYGISDWAKVAYKTTLRAANAKDYMLRRKEDRLLREYARQLVLDKGYILATPAELENLFDGLFKADGNAEDLHKTMLWAIDFCSRKRDARMKFVPIYTGSSYTMRIR